MKPMNVDQSMAMIAQLAVNATEGVIEIEPGSLIHQAAEELCRHAQAGFTIVPGGLECPPRFLEAVGDALRMLEQIAKRSSDQSTRALAEGTAADLRAQLRPASLLDRG